MGWATPRKKSLSSEERIQILDQYMRCAPGRQQLSKSLVGPFNTHLGYHAIYRRILQKEELPFCEPLVIEQVIQASDIDTFTGDWHETAQKLVSVIDMQVVLELDEVDREVVDCAREALARAGDFSIQPGHILLSAWDYAEVRKFCRDLTNDREEILILHNRPHYLNNMVFRVSRLVPKGAILFVPTPSGRYCENLEIEVIEEPNENGRPSFLFREKYCLDVDPSKVIGFEIHRS
jgi:hypothetical protein